MEIVTGQGRGGSTPGKENPSKLGGLLLRAGNCSDLPPQGEQVRQDLDRLCVGKTSSVQMEELIEIVRKELPPSCRGARVTRSKERVSVAVSPPFYGLTNSRKLVKMFVRKTQGVHVMVPPDLDLESRGWVFAQEAGTGPETRNFLFPFDEAEILARQLGQTLASFL